MDAGVVKKAITTGEEKALEAARLSSAMSSAVEDRMETARRAMKHGLHVAEDVLEDATHEMKKHPFRTVVTGFTIGMVTGAVGGWLLSRAFKK